ncbi:MAG: hypothetical protein ACRDKI_09780 [Solirubrobacterales bacterium]
MSTNPPQPPQGTPPPPPGEPQYGADDPKSKKQNKELKIALAAILGVALIVGAFFLGKSQESKKYDKGESGYNAIYQQGAESGAAAGAAAGTKQGKKEGVAEGTEQGKKEGLDEGISQGEAKGEKDGANAALGGLTGWSTDSPYIVMFTDTGNTNVPVAINSRTQMQPGVNYKICNSGNGICQSSASASSSSGGGATGSP